ncbi:MAG: hypothetical protein IPH88_13800 [Bacteroidales bacterium]|nr:hypothetical protein [Bacteroidales bacterium]
MPSAINSKAEPVTGNTGLELLQPYLHDSSVSELSTILKNSNGSSFPRLHIHGLVGSSVAMVSAAVFLEYPAVHMAVLPDKESAVYFCNDLENLFGESSFSFHKKRVLLFPTSYRRPYEVEQTDNSNVLMRTEVLKRVSSRSGNTFIVTYPEALSEKVVSKQYLEKSTMKLKRGEAVDLDFIYDLLDQHGFERVDFVVEPGQVALRGGIIDVFSYTNDYPYRLEFSGDIVESIRSFNPSTSFHWTGSTILRLCLMFRTGSCTKKGSPSLNSFQKVLCSGWQILH